MKNKLFLSFFIIFAAIFLIFGGADADLNSCGNGICDNNEGAEGCDPTESGKGCEGYIYCLQDCEEGCARTGEEGDVYGKRCCSGLTSVQINKAPIDGQCLSEYPPYGTQFYCINCGDGVCGLKENKCNCPQDCVGEKSPIKTTLNIVSEQKDNETKLTVELSKGKKAEIKVMPETASQRAIEVLGLKVCSQENNCTIELKEVGEGENAKPVYEVKAEKEYRFLWIFKLKAEVKAEINAETGKIISTKRPWWRFLMW